MAKMSSLVLLKMSLLSLKRHPIRTGLALLGIVIGIGALIVMMALGKGADQKIQQEILAMGKDVISIYKGNFLQQDEVRQLGRKNRPLTQADYQAIQAQIPNLGACTPYVDYRKTVKFQNKRVSSKICGVNETFTKLETRKVILGSFFSTYHNQAGSKVAVIGFDVSKRLFGLQNPLGQPLATNTGTFKVIGVLEPSKGQADIGHNADLDIFVPFSTLRQEQENLDAILLIAKDGKDAEKLLSSIRRLLRFRHQIIESQPDDFTIWDQKAFINAASKSSKTLNYFLLAAAALSLVVGGIGVMNIMLVAMTERKKEIGLRMAIGAKSFQILIQFLFESILLCLLGGLLGVGIGIAAAFLVGYFTQFPWLITPTPIVVSLCTTCFVGVFFGFYPAYKASKLHPIEALHSV